MGNPAPFQARSRLRRAGAINRLSPSTPSPWNHRLPSYDSRSCHRNCPCCNSTLDVDIDQRARYVPYLLSSSVTAAIRRRSAHRRPHNNLMDVTLDQDSDNVLFDQLQDNVHMDMDMDTDLDLDSQPEDDHDHDDTRTDDSDLDAIPFPYAAATTSTSSSSLVAPPIPPVPRLPSSSELDRLSSSSSSTRRPRVWPASTSLLHQFSDHDTPEPWMYGTLPRRAEVTIPRRLASIPRSAQRNRISDDTPTSPVVTPSSGFTAASATTATVHARHEHEDESTRQDSLVGNVLRNVYSSLTSLLTGTSSDPGLPPPPTHTPAPPSSSSAPRRVASPLPLLPPLGAPPSPRHADPTDLTSLSVSSATPISRPRHTPRSTASPRPTGLALAPTLSARMRGTLASAAAAAQGALDDPAQGPATGAPSPRRVPDTALRVPTGARAGPLMFPPTPPAFYATTGVVPPREPASPVAESSMRFSVLDPVEYEARRQVAIREHLRAIARQQAGALGGRGGRGATAVHAGAAEGEGEDDDDDDDELGPMDDSWEMVVRPFESGRAPQYEYHEHMF